MQRAIDDVRNGVCLVKEAVRIYNVPRSTLRDKLADRHMTEKGACNRKFTDKEESYLADILLKSADLGVPLGKPMLKRLVTTMAVEKGLANNRLCFSNRWHQSFLKRHPEVRQRVSHSVNRKKAREWTAETCEDWLTILGELNAEGYLTDPTGIYNLDESAFSIAEKVRLVYARKGTKEVLSYMDGTDRDIITVLACGNAAGCMLPPLILFDGKLHVASRFEGTDDRCYLAVDSSGIMDCPTFASYIRDVVIPSMSAEKIVIFIDGHSSHIFNLEFIEACSASGKDIKIVCFPAGQTNKLQPLDKSVFGPVKKYWRDYLRELATMLTSEVTKQSFAGHLMSKWDDFNLENNLKSGFEKTGLFPYDPCVIAKDFDRPSAAPAFVPPQTVAEMYSERLLNIRNKLKGIHPLTEDGIAEILSFIIRRAEGFIPSIPAADVAQKLHDQLLLCHPAKKRQLKDSGLCTKVGAVVNKSAFEDGIRFREAEKAPKANATAAKRSTPAPKVNTKKRPLADITNTPPKKRFRQKI